MPRPKGKPGPRITGTAPKLRTVKPGKEIRRTVQPDEVGTNSAKPINPKRLGGSTR